MVNQFRECSYYTKFFTPKEYQIELLDAAKERNIISCIGSIGTKTFIALKLIQDLFMTLERSSDKKLAFMVAETHQNISHYASTFIQLTNLKVADFSNVTLPLGNMDIEKLQVSQVVVGSSSCVLEIVCNDHFCLDDISLLIVDECHYSTSLLHPMNKLMEVIHNGKNIRIVGMTYPLHTTCDLNPGKIEADLDQLQRIMRCTVETASDTLSIIRYNHKPIEHLIECDTYEQKTIDEIILKEITDTVEWIKDHRFDPSEIYDDEFFEDIKDIPNPNTEPLKLIDDFVNILITMGPWCANKAALASLFSIEKMKVKTPYERHFLTLCIVSTLMLKIRTIYDNYFSKYNEQDLVYTFISPKVRRLIEILRQYKPSKRLIMLPETAEVKTPDGQVGSNGIKDSTVLCDNKNNQMNELSKDCSYLTMNDSYIQYKSEKNYRWRTRRRGVPKPFFIQRPKPLVEESESVCCVIFVKNRLTATIIHYILSDLKRYDDENFWWLSSQFTTEKTADPEKEPRDAELQHRRLEDVLRRFRCRECNILIGTSMLEEDIDLPKCNLVIRFDAPESFRSYLYSKSKANVQDAHYFTFFETSRKEAFIKDLAKYYKIQELLLARCNTKVESADLLNEADKYNDAIIPYCTTNNDDVITIIKPSDAISYINRYCAKLPSDSFTRLTPLWQTKQVEIEDKLMYVTSLRLPINSPFKKEVVGYPMPNEVLSKRIVALEVCRILHQCGELDDNMQPIGKENFHLFFSVDEIPPDDIDQVSLLDPNDPRPGTNKRRQYYPRKIPYCLTDCCPKEKIKLYFYSLEMLMSCPIPEEQNIRGRKLNPPEESPMGFGILLRKKIPTICPFPIFTRCGEVIVTLQLRDSEMCFLEEQLIVMQNFLLYTFTKVLRLQKYYMKFNPYFNTNSYYIVPTKKLSNSEIVVDWDFLSEINFRKDDPLICIPDDIRQHFIFKRELYSDAVVMPWYRNQDLPQFFYVAEICNNLTPKSKFPGEEYKSFEEYYFRKYQLKIKDLNQPLLDVDHTSARLNFLTPRYVNRKGVALPTCSEATKKARRENLEQKQILVPELCTIHPFPASLWRKAVCLPCILYRINSLLLAEHIRYKVSIQIDLGLQLLPEGFCWPRLDFGWTLADVIKRTAELKEAKLLKEMGKLPVIITEIISEDIVEKNVETADNKMLSLPTTAAAEILESIVKNENDGKDNTIEDVTETEPILEIGTWSNEMASDIHDYSPEFETNFAHTFLTVRYGSPTRWMDQNEDDDLDSYGDYSEDSDESFENPSGIRIEFKSDFLAEAHDEIIEDKDLIEHFNANKCITWDWDRKEDEDKQDGVVLEINKFEEAVLKNIEEIKNSQMILTTDHQLFLKPYDHESSFECNEDEKLKLPYNLSPITGYALNNNNNNLFGILQNNIDGVHSVAASDSGCSTAKTGSNNCSSGSSFDSLITCNEDEEIKEGEEKFSFDHQPELVGHIGPSPSIILQALTMSNANDGLNLERLETIGDSFLKYAITTYLYCTYDSVHEGKLSHLRSKQVSNLNLYRLGKMKSLGRYIVGGKFDPHDSWLPPCFSTPVELEKALINAKTQSCYINKEDLPYLWHLKSDGVTLALKSKLMESSNEESPQVIVKDISDLLPFHLLTYQNVPDKSIADCVEALIGAYLISCGIRGAMLFMSWLGIKVLPVLLNSERTNVDENSKISQTVEYGYLKLPPSPLLRNVPDPETELDKLLAGYDEFEQILRYRFRDRSYLLQALTHASFFPNRVTDCYQRLEFLGDAVLDYLITRHLFEDKRRHSPGALTDLRSALVNNTIFASLAIRFGFHKFFLHLSPALADVIHRFVRIQEDNGHTIFEEYYLIGEEECEEAEDVEVPKALGDIFESVAGAVFLDSGASLDIVWRVFYRIMKNEIEQFSTNVPKSPIRELLELEPETAKFGRPEKLADGRRIRVTVEVFGKGSFKGIGRNYRIAKCTAAKCALKQLKKRGLLKKSNNANA